MSADNYVIVKKFGKNDYRWGMGFLSEGVPDLSNEFFKHGPFSTPLEAVRNAYKECSVIEYGIEYINCYPNCPNCFKFKI